ncbi:sensor histidine kinase [Candidatus Solirubrobacter pratensis]|uniref:sensor histidine kinase n=1 Tax=Candidatus Solirubrobacter pratensis TaxID=1298857 RepID=UPI000420D733|nr:sensor domain-containing protein [Candidatus Solirubrobacter pratensis]
MTAQAVEGRLSVLGLRRRFDRAGHAAAYLLLGLPVAILSIPAVLALLLGAALSSIGLGLPLLIAAAAACRGLVRADRRAANRWLGAGIPPVPGRVRTAGGALRQALDILSDRLQWRYVAHLSMRPLLTAAMFAVALIPVLLLAQALALGVQGVAGVGDVDFVGPWTLGPALGLIMLALTLPAAALVIATFESLYGVLATITRAFLAARAVAGGPVREALAESLGDSSVSVAYWLPDRARFVDESGRPVELPEPGSGRTWTAVERDGRRVAAIIHDAALDTTAELVQAAAAASSLAIDNERLKADLAARVEELRVSRLRIIEAGDAARRRIERDLHDGAQQQLVALALELRVLRASTRGTDLERKIDDLSGRLATALAELRELARGIHPAILTDRGLAPAIGALAERGTIPIETDVRVQRRLAPPVEAAAYFLVAEALTNVSRYAHATCARVEVVQDGDEVLVLIADDGVGGVDLEAGSGLRGLQDRLAAVGGTLRIDSPPGAGTRLHARIPCP